MNGFLWLRHPAANSRATPIACSTVPNAPTGLPSSMLNLKTHFFGSQPHLSTNAACDVAPSAG